MPTHISEKEAKKIKAREAQARARQWRDEMREAKSQKRTSQSTAKKTTKAPAVRQEKEEANLLYRKTPSREDRAKTHAKARASAREWSNQRKKNKVLEVYNDIEEVPYVVETNGKREEGELTISDDFKTARAAESPNAPRASYQIDESHVKELRYLKNDVDNMSNRIQSICDVYAQKVDAMDCE